jgi:lipoyl synthase
MNEHIHKPEWLKIRLGNTEQYAETRRNIGDHQLHTICTSGRCPNQAECWGRGTATFMILGDICTRSCRFCNTNTGKPNQVDILEPKRLAESIKQMAVKHIVLTSVDRDDLPDLGVGHWIQVIRKVRAVNPSLTMEVLIPDFQGDASSIQQIINEKPEVVSHNVETVRRLTPSVRSASNYERSLLVLTLLADGGLRTKSGLMLGLGETETELFETMDDLVNTGCKVLTLGQYLQPTRHHLPVQAYIHPDVFLRYKTMGLEKGFEIVESGPLVRSSYRAEKHL